MITPGRIYSEIQVGGGSMGRYKLDRRAYVASEQDERRELSRTMSGRDADRLALKTPDPGYWPGRLRPEPYATGTVARYVCGSDLTEATGRRNPFDQIDRMLLAEGPAWLTAAYREVKRAHEAGERPVTYWGKPGAGPMDLTSFHRIRDFPGVKIVDATNGADGRPDWMPDDWWGEAMVRFTSALPGYGQYAFADNALTEGGDERIKDAVVLASNFSFPTILSCHQPEHFEWLLGTTVTKLVNGPADMPTWEILLKSGISLAFRGDEEKVNGDLGGRLSKLKEVAG